MSYQLHVAEYVLELCMHVFRTVKQEQEQDKNRQAKQQVGSLQVCLLLDVPSHDLPCKRMADNIMLANPGPKFPLLGHVQSFILHARLLDQTNRMQGPTESNLCSSDYSAICSKEINSLRTVPAQNVDGRLITSNWFSIYLSIHAFRAIIESHRTHKEQSMCDMCGYDGLL